MPSDPAPPVPPAPPPLPPALPAGAGGEPAAQRLHPLTLLFTVWNAVSRFLVPALILLVLRKETYIVGFMIAFVVVPVLFGLVRYYTFTYRIENGELITRQGILNRSERNIPLTRIQDVRIEQGVLHRLLHMVDVHIDTAAGGEGTEATLSVLARPEADRLRAAVLALKSRLQPGAQAAGQPVTPPPIPRVLRRLTTGDLIRAGLTSNHLASTAAILAVLWGLADDVISQEAIEQWVQSFVARAESWTTADLSTYWVLAVGASVLALLVGMVVSVVGSIVLFHGFTVSRVGSELHRSYGLLTRRSSTLPLRRIQVLKIEEKPLRRCFRLATLRADTAGGTTEQGRESKSGRDVLLPIVPRQDAESLLPEFLPDLDPDGGTWTPVSRRAIYRGTLKGALACLCLTGVNLFFDPTWHSLWPILLIVPVYFLNLQSYRHLGYWMSDRYLRTRRGWLSRAGHVIPIRNVQSIVIHQTPFDRRHRVGTLQVDSAGQVFTGGGPEVSNIPWKDLQRLAWTVARQASVTRYRW